LLKNHSPQLFVYGGNRVRPHKADLEDILPLAFFSEQVVPNSNGKWIFRWTINIVNS
jgi:hypothetical protein